MDNQWLRLQAQIKQHRVLNLLTRRKKLSCGTRESIIRLVILKVHEPDLKEWLSCRVGGCSGDTTDWKRWNFIILETSSATQTADVCNHNTAVQLFSQLVSDSELEEDGSPPISQQRSWGYTEKKAWSFQIQKRFREINKHHGRTRKRQSKKKYPT